MASHWYRARLIRSTSSLTYLLPSFSLSNRRRSCGDRRPERICPVLQAEVSQSRLSQAWRGRGLPWPCPPGRSTGDPDSAPPDRDSRDGRLGAKPISLYLRQRKVRRFEGWR